MVMCIPEEGQDPELDQPFQFVDKYTGIKRNTNEVHGVEN